MKKREPSFPENLPIETSHPELLKQQDRSRIWKVEAHDGEVRQAGVIKEVIDLVPTEEAMRLDQELYDFIKKSPIGKFVADTQYFKVEPTAEGTSRLFRFQKFIEGKQIDQLTDRELYRDRAVVEQLLEFIDGAIALLKEAREQEMMTPDLRRAPEDAPLRVQIGMLLSDPRYSSNIMVSERPDKNGQRIFYIDAAPNTQERESKFQNIYAREVVSRMETGHLLLWKKKVEKILKYDLRGVRYEEGTGLVIDEDVKSPERKDN